MALTPRCGPRRRADPTRSTCGEAALLQGEGLKVRAHALLSRTLCARLPLTLPRTASPQPALTALLARQANEGDGLRSKAPLDVVLTGMHHAHRRCAHHLQAQRHHAPKATAPRSTRSTCAGLSSAAPREAAGRQAEICSRALESAGRRPGTHVPVRKPLYRVLCREQCRRELCVRVPCPCPCGVWPTCPTSLCTRVLSICLHNDNIAFARSLERELQSLRFESMLVTS